MFTPPDAAARAIGGEDVATRGAGGGGAAVVVGGGASVVVVGGGDAAVVVVGGGEVAPVVVAPCAAGVGTWSDAHSSPGATRPAPSAQASASAFAHPDGIRPTRRS
ncbi:MAG: hypothetical protein E6G30_02990 [Actinobacteria bacterium]|nr:MAG: hypothetical protein E6G30_02990 [Actinomycetota bacterium]